MYNPPLQGAAHEQPEIGQAMTAADGNQAKMADAGNTTDTTLGRLLLLPRFPVS